MKKTLRFISAVALFSLTTGGCAKEETTTNEVLRTDNFSVRAICTQEDTKTSIDTATGKVDWLGSDQCGAFITGNSLTNVLLATTDEEPGVFTGTVDESLAGGEAMWAYYPYSADATIHADGLTTTLPASQEYSQACGKYALMTSTEGQLMKNTDGTFEAGSVHFSHKTSGYLFNIYGSLREASVNPESLISVTITATTPLAGTVSVGKDGTTDLSAAEEMTVEVRDGLIPVGYARDKGAKMYMSILPNEAHAISRIVVETDQAVYTKEVTINKETLAGNIYPINLNLNTFTSVSKKNALGVPGDHNEWDKTNGITGRTAGFFSGKVDFSGKYKYYRNDIWYGISGEPYTLYYTLSTPGGDFTITGSYYVIADIAGSNASLVNAVTMPGTWNWDVATAPEFVYDEERDLWTISEFAMTEGQEFKIAFNKTWVNMMNRSIKGGGTIVPGTPVRLEYDGDKNITVGATGTYDITLDLSTYGGTLVLEPAAVQ